MQQSAAARDPSPPPGAAFGFSGNNDLLCRKQRGLVVVSFSSYPIVSYALSVIMMYTTILGIIRNLNTTALALSLALIPQETILQVSLPNMTGVYSMPLVHLPPELGVHLRLPSGNGCWLLKQEILIRALTAAHHLQ